MQKCCCSISFVKVKIIQTGTNRQSLFSGKISIHIRLSTSQYWSLLTCLSMPELLSWMWFNIFITMFEREQTKQVLLYACLVPLNNCKSRFSWKSKLGPSHGKRLHARRRVRGGGRGSCFAKPPIVWLCKGWPRLHMRGGVCSSWGSNLHFKQNHWKKWNSKGRWCLSIHRVWIISGQEHCLYCPMLSLLQCRTERQLPRSASVVTLSHVLLIRIDGLEKNEEDKREQ